MVLVVLVHFASLKKKSLILLRYYQAANILQLKIFFSVMTKTLGHFPFTFIHSQKGVIIIFNNKNLHIFHRILHMLWLSEIWVFLSSNTF